MSENSQKELRPLDIVLLLLATVPFFVNLGKVGLWGSEGRFANIAQNMQESHAYLEPRDGEEFYGDKPLLFYWCIALSAQICGEMNEAVARLPSVLSGIASVLLIGWMASRLFDRRVGVLAGWILASSYSFFFWSRNAVPEIAQLTCILGSLAIYLHSQERLRPWHVLSFFGLMAIGGQIKGMPGVLLPVAVATTDIVISRRREIFENKKWLFSGAALFFLLYLTPFVLSRLQRGDWDLLGLMWKENFIRAANPFDHRDESAFYYCYVLPAMLFPWTFWLPGTLGWAIRRCREHRGFAFFLLTFSVVFVFFSLSGSRRSYYILPALPFAAAMIAAYCVEMAESSPSRIWAALSVWPLRLLISLFLLVSASVLLSPWLSVLGIDRTKLPSGIALFAGILLIGTVIVMARIGQRTSISQFRMMALLGISLCVGLSTVGEEIRDGIVTERSFVAQTEQFQQAGTLTSFGFDNENFEFYARSESRIRTVSELVEELHKRGHTFAPNCDGGIVLACNTAGLNTLEKSDALRVRVLIRSSTTSLPPFAYSKDQYFLVCCEPR